MKFRSISFSVVLPLLALSALAQADPPLDVIHQTFVNGAADAAILSLQGWISANPLAADANNLLCRVWYSEERWDAAVTACERAVSLNPKSSLFQLWLGRAYGEKADHSSWFTAIALAKKTRTCFERAVDLDARNVEARSDLSEYYIEAPGFLGGGTDKAGAQANAVEKIEPATAFYIRARIAEHDKRNSDAEQEYKKAIDLNSNSWRRWVDLASFYRRVNRLDDLEAAVKKAAELDSQNDSTLVDCASLLLRVNRNLHLAAELLHRYIEKGTKSEDAPLFQAQYVLGQVLEKQGNVPAAKAAYQTAKNHARDFAPAGAALKRVGA
ncbi:MAG: tetratricopeptide repeat protein [Acidobacteria bacterium]|nr:tetratricopeptide repeat protein [Acidobacteriota bacterium]MBV9144862.1 tetratricopeptide repeat protein [Acidobacteriota bacterium]MBV9437541.1 tetratricopeptide repeat protein [Acidobacteriota bacterium]